MNIAINRFWIIEKKEGYSIAVLWWNEMICPNGCPPPEFTNKTGNSMKALIKAREALKKFYADF